MREYVGKIPVENDSFPLWLGMGANGLPNPHFPLQAAYDCRKRIFFDRSIRTVSTSSAGLHRFQLIYAQGMLDPLKLLIIRTGSSFSGFKDILLQEAYA